MDQLGIDFTNALSDAVGKENGVTAEELAKISSRAADFNIDFPFMQLPEDKRTIDEIAKFAESVRCRFQNLIVLGIGGSALGLKSMAQAVLPPYFNLLDSKARGGAPRLFICDNIDPDSFEGMLKLVDWKSTCINVISKSGKTTETASQFYVIKDILVKKLGAKKWKEHVVVTTDPTSGPLRIMVTLEHLQSLSIPTSVGGRYSVLSSVGLFPAAAVGMDIHALSKGASEMVRLCSVNKLDENPALKNGAVHYLMDTSKKKPSSVMMPYSDSLALLSDWYAQLWAESLGKAGKGPTPLKAVGATDQHSQIQLYMEGPNDKVVTFVGAEKFKSKVSVPTSVANEFAYIAGKDMGEILKAEQKATAMALTQAKRPNVTVTLPEINEYYLGQYYMLYQIQTAFTGYLYGINPFDQPGVELGKKFTVELLNSSK